MNAAVVPIKNLAASKSRLQPDLGAEATERLSIAMLHDVLDALRGVATLDRIAVVTPDPAVERTFAHLAEILVLDVVGLNPSIDAAATELTVGPDDALLVVLGDVAGAEASELQKLLDACDRPGIALAPSSDGGTSALVRRPPDIIPARFGKNSAAAHRAAAADANVPCLELALPSLTIDIDDIADVLALRASPRTAGHTRAALAALDPALPA